ncbi:MAG: hydrolase 1, exosortase A system-associated [Candidatus Brocadiaceae bacterium]|nr:hydrolase 1, exosortase A system-associated [Candidatus Brocadiaceae bacterium]
MISKFIQGSAGPCYVSLYLPDSVSPKSWVLCFPPFAEEMNKSRSMMSAQARALASKGVAVVIPDLAGTGDSGLDFSEATWEAWQIDMIRLVEWIREQAAGKLYFWGIRLGCLLALDVACELDSPITGMLFWQPVSSGKQAMNQFLRLRMAASMMEGEQEKVDDLRKRLSQGGNLEVAGYEVSPSLVHEIDRKNLMDMTPNKEISIAWFEVSGSVDKPLTIISRKIIDNWQQSGVKVDAEMVVGDPFWMTQGTTMAPDLIQRMKTVFSDSVQKKNSQPVDLTGLPTDPSFQERPVIFQCGGETLTAILHSGPEPIKRGVLLVVGGPQYRVGSHRQFVLLARYLASHGIPVFRFDYRGMGDSSGNQIDFECIEDDIRSAINHFQEELPGIKEIVIWGLCDAATAASFYAPSDQRVKGLVLLNPWVHSQKGEAKAYIKHYYLGRFFSWNFWSMVLRGKYSFLNSLRSFWQILGRASEGEVDNNKADVTEIDRSRTGISLAARMEVELSRFAGQVMFILSGKDLTAAEFEEVVKASSRFRKIMNQERVRIKKVGKADHTFSRRIWRDSVARTSLKWLKIW